MKSSKFETVVERSVVVNQPGGPQKVDFLIVQTCRGGGNNFAATLEWAEVEGHERVSASERDALLKQEQTFLIPELGEEGFRLIATEKLSGERVEKLDAYLLIPGDTKTSGAKVESVSQLIKSFDWFVFKKATAPEE